MRRFLDLQFSKSSIKEASEKFKIDRFRVLQIYKHRNELKETRSQKRRTKGGGRKLDDWWKSITQHIKNSFKKYREEYNLQVTPRHLLIWAQEACIEKGIDLKENCNAKTS